MRLALGGYTTWGKGLPSEVALNLTRNWLRSNRLQTIWLISNGSSSNHLPLNLLSLLKIESLTNESVTIESLTNESVKVESLTNETVRLNRLPTNLLRSNRLPLNLLRSNRVRFSVQRYVVCVCVSLGHRTIDVKPLGH